MKLTGQNHGFDNERQLKSLINGKKFQELSSQIKNFLNDIFSYNIQENFYFTAARDPEYIKPDLKIQLYDGINLKSVKYVSIKSGDKGHSVHQEPASEFVLFLEKNGLLEDEIKNFYFFHWCDGTYDDTGGVENRNSLSSFRNQHQHDYNLLCQSLAKVRKTILHRLFYGDLPLEKDYFLVFIRNNSLYYWNFDKVLDFHDRNFNKKAVGNLNLQNWNACLQGQDSYTPKHRKDIQFKWGNILKDMEEF